MRALLQDIGYFGRTVVKSPGFFAVAVLTLALGIGANTAIFSVINAVLLRPLPFDEPDRLMRLFQTEAAPGNYPWSGPNYIDMEAQNRTFEATALFAWEQRANGSGTGQPETALGVGTEDSFFVVLGVRPLFGRTFTRGEIDDYTKFVTIYGAKGLAYIKVNDVTQLNETGLQSPIVKNLNAAALKTIIERTGAQNGDIIFFGADKAKIVNDAMGALRIKIGHEKGYTNGKAWEPLWVVDFPMFEYDDEGKRWNACHHPFTAPKDEHLSMLESDPGKCLAKAYDLALNGSEIGGGSVRIHKEAVQSQVFRALNIGAADSGAFNLSGGTVLVQQLVVTNGGTYMPLVIHSKYSARAQIRSGGPQGATCHGLSGAGA